MKKIMIMILACAAGVHAETKTWLGGDGNFATPAQWSGSAVPAAGDAVVISNGAVTVTSADSTFTGLASIVLGVGGTIACDETVETQAPVTFSTNSTLQVSAGELVFHGYASGSGFTKEGAGNVRFTGSNSSLTALVPGLKEGQLAGSFNLTSPNTGTRVSAALEKANTVWSSTDTTYAYSGEIYLDGSLYSFAENIDNNAYLHIGGTTVLSNGVYNLTTMNTLQLAAGWYPVELRVGNTVGVGGSGNVYSTGGGVAWKKEGLNWQILRDINGGGFLRTPGNLATDFTEGITLNDGSVIICTDTAAGTTNSIDANNNLGELTLNAGTLILSNSVCRATALDGVAAAMVRIDYSMFTLTNETDCTYLGTTAGAGTLEKNGSGRLDWLPLSSSHYAHTATIVNDGMLALGSNLPTFRDNNFGNFTVNAPGTVETVGNGNSQFYNLWGDGTLTNTWSGSAQQLRITRGPCEFSGLICGNIRYYSQGEVALTGTNSTFAYSSFGIHSSGGPGITGVKKIGMKGQPSSTGKATQIDIREQGGTFVYLGTGETTDKNFVLYPSGNRAVIDGGQHGGVTFNGAWNTSRNLLNRVAILGANASPCVFNGSFSETTQNGTNYSTYIAKEGPGTWIFNHNANRSNRGVIDVREGTLQFESIADAGQVCSLGRSDLLFEDVLATVTNGHGVSYAFSLGTATTEGMLEYIGTTPGSCSNRKLVLQGDGRLKSDGASLALGGGVESLTAGAKTLYLDGSATNAIGFVSDGAGTVGITKEGSGTWMFTSTNTFSGPLEIKEGQLTLDKRGYSYYKFNLLQRNYDISGGDTNIELTEFALYSADGVRRNLNLVANGINNVAGLNPGEFCPMATYPTYAGRTDINLFDADINSQWTVNTTGILPATPITLVMRLAEGTPPITGYDLQYWSSSLYRFLSGWSIEGSRDGVTWEQLDSATDFTPIPPATVSDGVKWWYSTGTTSPTNDFPIVDGGLTNAQLKAGVQVSVAAGAELAMLGGNEPLSALGVDIDAGGGTISDLFLVPNGRLDLTGSSIQGVNFTVPLTIENFSNPELLSSWSIYINGELIQGAVLTWNESTGTLRVVTLGTIIIVR